MDPIVPVPVKKNKISVITIFIGLIIPLIIVLVTVFTFFPFQFSLPTINGGKVDSTVIIPSMVLNNKNKYNQQAFTVQGKLNMDPIACDKIDCPANDSCCGCPTSRNLSLKDANETITGKSNGSFQLVDQGGKSFCQRKLNSCTYDCQDWINGTVYDVTGQFFAQTPPPGWNMSLSYYFVPTSKTPTSTLQLNNGLTNFLDGIKQLYHQVTSSGGYVIR